jgi:hypothetical protein
MDLAKLSRLQRFILCAAYENRVSEAAQEGAPQVDLYYQEVLAGYFGFPVRWYEGDGLRSHPGSRHFDREAIGRSRYDAAQASLSRAVRRLEKRGLVTRYVGAMSRWSGLRLVDSAVEAASRLGLSAGSLPTDPDQRK